MNLPHSPYTLLGCRQCTVVFRFSSPKCTLHTAMTHVIAVLKLRSLTWYIPLELRLYQYCSGTVVMWLVAVFHVQSGINHCSHTYEHDIKSTQTSHACQLAPLLINAAFENASEQARRRSTGLFRSPRSHVRHTLPVTVTTCHCYYLSLSLPVTVVTSHMCCVT